MPLAVAAIAYGSEARAGWLFSDYNLGLSYDASASYAAISYDAPAQPAMPDNCDPSKSSKGRISCTAYLAPDSSLPTPGIYLESPFKRQGLLYGEWGFTFSTVEYSGGLVGKPRAATTTDLKRQAKEAPEQPLAHAFLEFYGVNWQAYVRFGLTPRYLPDVLLSAGVGVQTAAGRVKLFTGDYIRGVVQPDAFAEADLVLVRYKSGALTVYRSVDQNILGRSGSQLVDDHPSNTELTDFHLGLTTGALGAKLLFPF